MVGSIAFMKAGIRRTAVLSEDKTWSISPPLQGDAGRWLAGALADVSAGYGGPWDGPFGPRQLDEARAVLVLAGYDVVSVHLTPKRPMPPGTIY